MCQAVSVDAKHVNRVQMDQSSSVWTQTGFELQMKHLLVFAAVCDPESAASVGTDGPDDGRRRPRAHA